MEKVTFALDWKKSTKVRDLVWRCIFQRGDLGKVLPLSKLECPYL